MTNTMLVSDLTATVKDGEEHGWATEFEWLERTEAIYLDILTEDIRSNGIRKPVLIGKDGRLWDGHHRVYAAVKLGLESIPVEHA